MKMPNITPGPWFTEKPDHSDQSIAVSTKTYDPQSSHKTWSGFIQCYGIQDEPQIGSRIMQINAQAVAALPDLMEALIVLVEMIDPEGHDINFDDARDALLKAGCTNA